MQSCTWCVSAGDVGPVDIVELIPILVEHVQVPVKRFEFRARDSGVDGFHREE